MLSISHLVRLVFFSGVVCVVIATGARAVGDPVVTYKCSERPLRGFPRLDEAGVDDLVALQASGSVTSVDLVNAYIERIHEVNHLLHAVGEINPDALKIAASLDAERTAGHVRGPLHGIPILIKDNIATQDRMNNTGDASVFLDYGQQLIAAAGSFALVGATVSRDATVVTKLRNAGAVILGKATMGEWAQMRSRKASSSHGWSAYGGQSYGAYYPQQDPSGSSSGSAVAPSVGLALGALGTETSGSIVLPAEKSNLVGIKPTLGLTSRSMVIPISVRQDTVGPMARSVKDAAYMLSAISGKDKYDNWTLVQPFDQTPNYVKACNHSALKGVRLGIPRNGISPFLSHQNAPIMAAFEEALEIITAAGARVWDDANFASFNMHAFQRNSSIVLDTDFAIGLANYFSMLQDNPNNVRNLRDLAQFTRSDLREGYPDRDIYVWDRVLGLNITNESPESYSAYKANLNMADELGVTGTLDKYNLDALVMPTFASFHLPAIAGLPLITVPLGFFPSDTPLVWNPKKTGINVAPQIPFGIAFVGRRWSEEKLIALAYAFEQRTLARQKMGPYIAPSFELGDHAANTAQASRSFSLLDRRRTWTVSKTVQSAFKGSIDGLLSTQGWMWAMFGVFETLD